MPAVPLVTAIDALLNDRTRPVEDVIGQYFTDDYRQRIGGRWLDRAGFRAAMEQVRGMTSDPIEITALDDLSDADGVRFAERHVLVLTVGGVTQRRETSVFGSRAADGRFAVIEDVTLVLDADGNPVQ